MRRLTAVFILASAVLGAQFLGHSARLAADSLAFVEFRPPVLFAPQGPLQQTYPATNLYGVYQEGTLGGSAFVVTVQQPASPTKTLLFQGGTIYCAPGCNPTLEINGTAATTTAASVISINTAAATATAKVYSSSNAGTGTVVYRYPVPAAALVPVLASGLSIGRIASQNFTIRSDSITGNYRVLLMWSEQ